MSEIFFREEERDAGEDKRETVVVLVRVLDKNSTHVTVATDEDKQRYSPAYTKFEAAKKTQDDLAKENQPLPHDQEVKEVSEHEPQVNTGKLLHDQTGKEAEKIAKLDHEERRKKNRE